ncbi:MAG: RCC1-like domain-containing protein [Pseudonocardiaceae bacterium]
MPWQRVPRGDGGDCRWHPLRDFLGGLSLVLRADGIVWAWGYNVHGQPGVRLLRGVGAQS